VSRHPAWCPADYRCNLGEHRSDPIIADVARAGRAVVTRVERDGRSWAEVRVRVELSDVEERARWQLAVLLRALGRSVAAAGQGRRRIWRD
jgi:hypothetical protein